MEKVIFFKTDVAGANCSGAMEADTIQKHGRSSTSLKGRGNFLKIACFVLLATSVFSANAQDFIVLKNGNDIQAVVSEIGTDDVKYKKFDNPDGPTYTLKKSEIFMIRYANGSRDVFGEAAADTPPAAQQPTPATPARQSSVQHQAGRALEPLSIQGIKIYNSDGVKLSKYEVKNIMGNVPEAIALYNSGNSLRTVGWVFYGLQLGSLFMALGSIEEVEVFLAWGTTSLVFAVPAIIFASKGGNKIKNSVGAYNRGIRQTQTSLNLGITQSGKIGLILNF